MSKKDFVQVTIKRDICIKFTSNANYIIIYNYIIVKLCITLRKRKGEIGFKWVFFSAPKSISISSLVERSLRKQHILAIYQRSRSLHSVWKSHTTGQELFLNLLWDEIPLHNMKGCKHLYLAEQSSVPDCGDMGLLLTAESHLLSLEVPKPSPHGP